MNHQLLIKIKSVTDTVHAHVDEEMRHIKKSCKRGCNSCCHQIVDFFTWEEPKIIEYISSAFGRKTKREISRNIEKWFKEFNKNTRDADRDNPLGFQDILQIQHIFREKRIPCPFLVKSECSIYHVRPMACRVHYEKNSSENCKNNPHLNTPNDAQEICHRASSMFRPEIFPVATKPLVYLVAGEFNINIKSKPMVGIIYDPKNMFARI